MDVFPKKPFSIIVKGHCYTVHEQERNKFFVTHETSHSLVTSLVETGIFVLSDKKIWHVEGESEISEEDWLEIFHIIESEIG